MKVEQITLRLQNVVGSLADITSLLAANGINIRTISLSDPDAGDFGSLRILVNDPEKAKQLLAEHGYAFDTAEVLVIGVPDKPGGLACILQAVKDAALNVEYLYAFSQRSGESGLIIFYFKDPQAAMAAFSKTGIHVLSSAEVNAL